MEPERRAGAPGRKPLSGPGMNAKSAPAKELDFSIPEEYAEYLRIGTCSWKYDSWKGLVYDAGKTYRAQDYLADYARRLTTVEVDQWFWSLFPQSIRLPEKSDVKRYAESVPGGFVFSIKAPNALTLTHFYSKLSGAEKDFAGQPNKAFLDNGLLERFLERLEPLGKKRGPLMFQFEYLNKQKMATKEAFFEAFGAFIEKAPQGVAYAVEIRNPNYLCKPFFDFLAAHKLGFVYLDGYYMPPIGKVFEEHQPHTARFSIIRLHGGDRGEIEKETGEVWNRIVAPKPEALQAAARITVENIRQKIKTIVNVNNHFEGSAPLTIGRFLDVLGRTEQTDRD
jgi:uncharacterized protein YecE (DUF72 family)